MSLADQSFSALPVDTRRSAVTVALVAGGTVLALLVALDAGGPLRLVLAVTYLLGAPGAALVRWLGIDDLALRASLVLALSVAVDLIVAQTLVWAGAFDARAGVVAVVLVTWSALAAATARRRRCGGDRP